jgi:hypothetical protein
MKRLLAFALSLGLVTVMAAPAFAGGPPEFKGGADVVKAPLYQVPSGDSGNVSDVLAGGTVTLVTPPGEQVLNVNGSVVGLAPHTAYDVWMRDLDPGYSGTYLYQYLPLGYYKLVRFTTDEVGAGSFHIGFKTSVLDDGPYNVQVAINTANDTYGLTVQATKYDIALTIK